MPQLRGKNMAMLTAWRIAPPAALIHYIPETTPQLDRGPLFPKAPPKNCGPQSPGSALHNHLPHQKPGFVTLQRLARRRVAFEPFLRLQIGEKLKDF